MGADLHTSTVLCNRLGEFLLNYLPKLFHCGYVAERDLNAVQDSLRLGSTLQDGTCANGRSVSWEAVCLS